MGQPVSVATLGVGDLPRARAYNVASPAEVATVLAGAERAGTRTARAGGETSWDGCYGAFLDSDPYPREVADNTHWALNDDAPYLSRNGDPPA